MSKFNGIILAALCTGLGCAVTPSDRVGTRQTSKTDASSGSDPVGVVMNTRTHEVGGAAGAFSGNATLAKAGVPNKSDAQAEVDGGGAGNSGGNAAGNSGGNVGIGGSLASPDVKLAPCFGSARPLCEDFETDKLNTTRWMVKAQGGTVKIDGVHVKTGGRALHLQVPAGGQSQAYIREVETFPTIGETFWIRFFAYLDSDLPTGNVHEAILTVGGENRDGVEISSEIGFGGQQEFVGNLVRSNPFAESPKGSSELKVPTRKWFCAEIKVDASTKITSQIYVDGIHLGSIDEEWTDVAPPAWNYIALGFQQYHPTPLVTDMWVDDFAVDVNKIGCGP